MRRSKEQKIELAQQICEAYSEGQYTIASICESFGVAERTFCEWAKDIESDKPIKGAIAEVAGLYKKAKKEFVKQKKEKLKELVLTNLERKIQGYEYDEVHNTYKTEKDEEGNPKEVLVSRTVKTKHVSPSDTAIIFAAKNLMPESFSETFVQKHEGEILTKGISSLSDEELEKELLRYTNATKKKEL